MWRFLATNDMFSVTCDLKETLISEWNKSSRMYLVETPK